MKKLLAILVGAIITTAEKRYRREEREVEVKVEKYCIYNNSSSSRGYSNSTYFNCKCNCN
jgi:hypothetical protein